MNARRLVLIATVGLALVPARARAQSLTTEAAITTGVSTDDVTAVATQLRAFGEAPSQVHYYLEAAWARTSDVDSDAFGAAYPYGNRLQIIEAYGERMFRPRGGIVGVRAGRYRSPFGIYEGSDHAYTGFLRAPLIRYDGYWALSNNFLEHGADLIVGVPRFTVEASLGAPADVGTSIRRPGLDTIVRAQAALGPAIIGVSHARSMPYYPEKYAFGKQVFTGVDVRWMRDGVQIRGEWIGGQSFNGVTTTGWYVDAIVHRLGMGPFTAVARVEQLDYTDVTPAYSLYAKRQAVGTRVRLLEGLSVQVNVLHIPDREPEYRPFAMDVGVTYTRRLPFTHP